MNTGERIRNARLALGMSQQELAFQTGYHARSSINKIEKRGNGIPSNKIMLFANALQVTPNYLLGLDEKTPDVIVPTPDNKSSKNKAEPLNTATDFVSHSLQEMDSLQLSKTKERILGAVAIMDEDRAKDVWNYILSNTQSNKKV